MDDPHALNISRLIVGIILIAVAVLMLALSQETGAAAGAIGLAVLGLISHRCDIKEKKELTREKISGQRIFLKDE